MLRAKQDWLVINPNIFVELATHAWIGIKLGLFEIYANLDATGYRATPIEYQAVWNFLKPE